jgi:hypothetical protein
MATWTAKKLLSNWGHDPEHVAHMAQLPRGQHWQRLLRKAEFWAKTADALQRALDVLADMPPSPEVAAAIDKVDNRIKAITCLRGEALKIKGVWLSTSPEIR